MATAHEIFVVQSKQRIGRVEELGVEDDLKARMFAIGKSVDYTWQFYFTTEEKKCK